MAQTEFTEVFNVAVAAGPVANTYITLGTSIPGGNAGSYVIKSMTYYASQILTAGPPYSFQIATNTMASGAGTPIYSTSAGVGTAYDITRPFTPTNQIILKQPFLGINTNLAAPGIFYLFVSYVFIPATNTLSDNFLVTSQNVASAAQTPDFSGSFAAQATIIKSIYVVNNTAAGSSTFDIYFDGQQLDQTQTLAQGETYQYTQPLYLNSSNDVFIDNNPGGAALQVIYSYIEDPA